MKNQTQIITPAIVLIALLASVAFADVPTTAGTISKVTVYQQEARTDGVALSSFG